MIYQPTNCTPSAFSGVGNGTIDIRDGLTVSWQINGTSALTAYRIVVQQNDTASTEVLDTGRVELAEPVYGTNYLGEQQLFTADRIDAQTLLDAGMTNGYGNGYKYLITQWWSEEDCVVQTRAPYFDTRSKPTLSIDTVANPLIYRSAEFTATYGQAENEPLDYFRWYIARTSDIENPIFDSGNIYGCGDIRCQYDGFFSGTEYAVRCIAQTASGVQADSGWTAFRVEYDTESLSGYVTACQKPGMNCIDVSWPLVNYISGNADGNYTIRNEQLILPDGVSIIWDSVTGQSMRFAPPWSIAWRGSVSKSGGVGFIAQGAAQSLSVRVSSETVSLIYNGVAIFTQEITLFPGDIFTVAILPDHIWVRQEQKSGGLYPGKGVYPRKGLYPRKSTTILAKTYDGAITLPQFAIESVSVTGEQICDYLLVESGTIPAATVQAMMESGEARPGRTDATCLYADFANGLNAGSLVAYADTIAGLSVYRQDGDSQALEHLVDIGISDQAIRDYGAKSQTTVRYYMFPLGKNTYISQPLASAQITPLFWSWVLLECEQDEADPDVYHVAAEYAFSCNVSTSEISNNNAPQILQNFTQYPTLQPSGVNYKSGTLQGLIGAVDYAKNVYRDSPALADALFALSVSTKPKFLKNRKGDLWRIEIGAAVTMAVSDNLASQAYTGAIPWVEVGDASGSSVISVPSDAFWTKQEE